MNIPECCLYDTGKRICTGRTALFVFLRLYVMFRNDVIFIFILFAALIYDLSFSYL